MDVRRNAPLETQHVLLLIDDEKNVLLPALEDRAKKNKPVYQGGLMMESGSISGWFLDSEDDFACLAGGLEELAQRAVALYPAGSGNPASSLEPFLFAVGDGNHSLASAKGIWEEYKTAHAAAGGSRLDHPCRYALVEIENIYDPAITFEPIHRVVFGLGFDDAIRLLGALPGFATTTIDSREKLVRLVGEPVRGNRFGLVEGNRCALIETSAGGISTACLQPLLDSAVSGAVSIDYIHGEDELFRLAAVPGKPVSGIWLPPVQKAGFFETVARTGPLPRKSFSMGEAVEKRFYVECRTLFG
jgi:hypothetical protein